MNCGAKVFEVWLLLRFELDLCLVVRAGARFDPLRGENDWLRLCAKGFEVPVGVGEVKTWDFGRSLDMKGPGDGEGESRLKGLLRQREPPTAEVDILPVSGATSAEVYAPQVLGNQILSKIVVRAFQNRRRDTGRSMKT